MYSCTTSNVQSVYSHIFTFNRHLSLGIHPTCPVLPCWLASSRLPRLAVIKKGKNSTVKKLTVNSKKPVSRSHHPRPRHANFPPFPTPPLTLSLSISLLSTQHPCEFYISSYRDGHHPHHHPHHHRMYTHTRYKVQLQVTGNR